MSGLSSDVTGCHIEQGHLLPSKRGSSVVPETGGEYPLFILSSVASLTGC